MKKLLLLPLFQSLVASLLLTAEEPTAPKAFLDKISALPGWKMLGKKDFAQVNCDPETFQFSDPGSVHCTG